MFFFFFISTYKCYDYAQKKRERKKKNTMQFQTKEGFLNIIYSESFKRRPPEELIDVLADYL